MATVGGVAAGDAPSDAAARVCAGAEDVPVKFPEPVAARFRPPIRATFSISINFAAA